MLILSHVLLGLYIGVGDADDVSGVGKGDVVVLLQIASRVLSFIPLHIQLDALELETRLEPGLVTPS